jgi:hypothetical protein
MTEQDHIQLAADYRETAEIAQEAVYLAHMDRNRAAAILENANMEAAINQALYHEEQLNLFVQARSRQAIRLLAKLSV